VQLEGIIFDFDGLILDTETAELDAWEPEFQRIGAPFPLDYFLWAVGRGAEQILKRPYDLYVEAGGTEPKEDVLERTDQRRLHLIHQRQPRPGIVEFLASARGEVQLAVASSSRHEWVDVHLERLGLLTYFDFTVCADDVPKAKPFPDLYATALQRMGLSGKRAFAIEDSANGVTAALAADLPVVAYPNGLTRHLDLSRASRICAEEPLSGFFELKTWFECGRE
jgi:HAD superfamily hydrolase (TIGR01509 family)